MISKLESLRYVKLLVEDALGQALLTTIHDEATPTHTEGLETVCDYCGLTQTGEKHTVRHCVARLNELVENQSKSLQAGIEAKTAAISGIRKIAGSHREQARHLLSEFDPEPIFEEAVRLIEQIEVEIANSRSQGPSPEVACENAALAIRESAEAVGDAGLSSRELGAAVRMLRWSVTLAEAELLVLKAREEFSPLEPGLNIRDGAWFSTGTDS